MRDIGIPKVMAWRWAPCAALVLGSLSFVGFALLAIPEHIGGAATEASSTLRLGGHFAANQASAPSSTDWSGSGSGFGNKGSAHVDSALPAPATRIATHGAEVFPKRGFTPPLERPEPPPPPVAPPPAVTLVPPPQQQPPAPAQPQPVAQPQPQPVAQPQPPMERAAPPEAPLSAQPELAPPGSGPAPGPVTPQSD